MSRNPLPRITRTVRVASSYSQISRRVRFFGRAVAVGCALAASSLANFAGAVALIGNGVTPSLTDLVNDPQRFYSFDAGVITWKMTQDFRDVFSSPHAQNQVRLAFDEWETASASAQRRSDSPQNRYEWNRFNGEQDGYDLQTVLIHEIGHAIGSQHPDAAWFNGSPQYMLNFRPNGSGGWSPSAPPGGEVMNEGNAVKNFGGAKGLLAGEYNRIVSRDEIAFLDYVYGAPLDFVEVGANEDAMITIDVFGTVGGTFGGALGVGGPDTSVARVAGDSSQGREILTASVGINAAAPIGIMSKSQTWEITNHSGKAIEAVSIRARGSSSRFPMAATSSGAHRFTLYEPSSAVGAFLFEDRGHEFHDPLGGSVPSGATVEVGLEIDVWDWTVVSSRARATDGTIFDVSLATPGIGSWFNTAPAGAVEPTGDDHGLISGLLGSSLNNVGAKGFFVQSPEGTRGRVTEIAVGRVDNRRLKPDNLNAALLDELRGAGQLHEFNFANLELGADDSLVFVLDGLVDDLPADLQASGRFELLNLPELADETLVVFVQTETADFTVGTYALLNAPLVRVPEPATVALGVLGLVALALRRRG